MRNNSTPAKRAHASVISKFHKYHALGGCLQGVDSNLSHLWIQLSQLRILRSFAGT